MKRFLTFLLGLLGFSVVSCNHALEKYGCPYATYDIKGQVTDENNQPLKDIQVVVQQYDTVYTDVEGLFKAQGDLWVFKDSMTVAATDIDGEANGGDFEPQIKTITYSSSDLQGGDGSWNEGTLTKEINFTLKKKD